MSYKNSIEIIAEIGVNHNGKVSVAKKLIDAAKKCGATAVKFQTFSTEKFVTRNELETTTGTITFNGGSF